MTKEDILTKYSDGSYKQFKGYENILLAMEEYAQQTIASHEAGKWKKYPENKPENGEIYWVRYQHGEEHECLYHDEYPWHAYTNIIAFRELHAPYQERTEK